MPHTDVSQCEETGGGFCEVGQHILESVAAPPHPLAKSFKQGKLC